ncbi:MAG: hypothetical protein AAB450_02645 [Patescibacteria group bacterium]
MKKSEILGRLGFKLEENLGLNGRFAGWFFYFDHQTFAFDGDGKVWTVRGLIDPGEIFFFAMDPILWEPEPIA